MIVAYQDRAIESIGYNLAAERLLRIAALQVPAFVIHNAGDSLEACVEALGPSMVEAGFELATGNHSSHGFKIVTPPAETINNKTPTHGPGGVRYKDLGLHMDKLSEVSPLPLTTVILHFTSEGTGEASLFEQSDAFLGSRCRELPDETQRLFMEGKVDDTILQPIRYHTRLRIRSLLAFRLEGLVHDFTSITLPRTARTRDIQHQARKRQLSSSLR